MACGCGCKGAPGGCGDKNYGAVVPGVHAGEIVVSTAPEAMGGFGAVSAFGNYGATMPKHKYKPYMPRMRRVGMRSAPNVPGPYRKRYVRQPPSLQSLMPNLQQTQLINTGYGLGFKTAAGKKGYGGFGGYGNVGQPGHPNYAPGADPNVGTYGATVFQARPGTPPLPTSQYGKLEVRNKGFGKGFWNLVCYGAVGLGILMLLKNGTVKSTMKRIGF